LGLGDELQIQYPDHPAVDQVQEDPDPSPVMRPPGELDRHRSEAVSVGIGLLVRASSTTSHAWRVVNFKAADAVQAT
jgi:hypothetical protein